MKQNYRASRLFFLVCWIICLIFSLRIGFNLLTVIYVFYFFGIFLIPLLIIDIIAILKTSPSVTTGIKIWKWVSSITLGILIWAILFSMAYCAGSDPFEFNGNFCDVGPLGIGAYGALILSIEILGLLITEYFVLHRRAANTPQ